jgi:hypothetical protein
LSLSLQRTYTEYSVVVQAFNRIGPGPMSKEVTQHTAEGKPDHAPQVSSPFVFFLEFQHFPGCLSKNMYLIYSGYRLHNFDLPVYSCFLDVTTARVC